jgi:hypothetical protein
MGWTVYAGHGSARHPAAHDGQELADQADVMGFLRS